MPNAFDGYEPNDYGHFGEDGDQSGTHAGYLRHKDNRVVPDDYKFVTSLDWAEYELATIVYDNKISDRAHTAILSIMQRLCATGEGC